MTGKRQVHVPDYVRHGRPVSGYTANRRAAQPKASSKRAGTVPAMTPDRQPVERSTGQQLGLAGGGITTAGMIALASGAILAGWLIAVAGASLCVVSLVLRVREANAKQPTTRTWVGSDGYTYTDEGWEGHDFVKDPLCPKHGTGYSQGCAVCRGRYGR